MTIDSPTLATLQSAVGRSETRSEILERESLRRFGLAVGVARDAPALLHWAFFLPCPADDEIGEDGHPRRGGFLPAIDLPRRMFAASDIRMEAPLLIGKEATLTSTIAGITAKNGRSGDLVFVDVDRVITQDDVTRVTERQSYVYRGIGGAIPLPVPSDVVPEGERWEPGPVNLFRFSAATFNGHRIHYDSDYARDEEGYPALVVHGPFTAAKLADVAARHGKLRRFTFRAEAPLFLGQPIFLQREGNAVRAIRCDGATAMTGTAEYA
jgi:3-methylfumaryl-CoA hydratase